MKHFSFDFYCMSMNVHINTYMPIFLTYFE